jgi:hypothetical protein
LPEGRFVHEADHQDAAAGMILDDGGDQAVRLFEIEIHCDTTHGNNKKPADLAAGVLSDPDEVRLGQGPSQDGMAMMMMPCDVNQCHKALV